MAKAIVMPALSPTMTEGKILKWTKKEGDKVKAGEAMAEIETDKATLELEAYDDGTLLKILVPEGESAAVGANIGVIGKPGEDISEILAAPPKKEEAPKAEEKKPEPKRPAAPRREEREIPRARPTPPRPAAAPRRAPGRRIKASPLARRMAEELGIELASIDGSGPGGRIIARDVEAASQRPAPVEIAAAPAAARPEKKAPALLELPPRPEEAAIELTGMRRTIATRMVEAKQEVPHFYLSMDVDMEKCVALREELKALGSRVSINDFVLKAAGFALLKLPEVNRSFEGDHIQQNAHVDVGMAVAVPDGLITPVIRDIDQMTLTQVNEAARDFATRARNKKLRPEEYTGGSVTVSNLGMYGVDAFLAIINPPQSVIIAVGQVADRAVVVDGKVEVRKRMWLTLSCDHRVVDGALGAQYLGVVKQALENPAALLV